MAEFRPGTGPSSGTADASDSSQRAWQALPWYTLGRFPLRVWRGLVTPLDLWEAAGRSRSTVKNLVKKDVNLFCLLLGLPASGPSRKNAPALISLLTSLPPDPPPLPPSSDPRPSAVTLSRARSELNALLPNKWSRTTWV